MLQLEQARKHFCRKLCHQWTSWLNFGSRGHAIQYAQCLHTLPCNLGPCICVKCQYISREASFHVGVVLVNVVHELSIILHGSVCVQSTSYNAFFLKKKTVPLYCLGYGAVSWRESKFLARFAMASRGLSCQPYGLPNFLKKHSPKMCPLMFFVDFISHLRPLSSLLLTPVHQT